MKKIRAVAILIKNDEILLIYRKNEKEYFVFPGGGVEERETIEQAVIRELMEETTIEVKINKLLNQSSLIKISSYSLEAKDSALSSL